MSGTGSSGPPVKKLKRQRDPAQQSILSFYGNEAEKSFCDGFCVKYSPKGVGSCQFMSVADQLSSVCNIRMSHTELRQQCVDFIVSNPCFVDGITHASHFIESDADTGVDWNKYVSELRDEATYGNHLSLQAMANMLNVQFLVLSKNTQRVCVHLIASSCTYNANIPLLILGHYGEECGEHYVSLSARSTENVHRLLSAKDAESLSASFADNSLCTFSVDRAESDNKPGASSVVEHECHENDTDRVIKRNTTDLGTLTTGPVQPILRLYPRTKFGKNSRSFSTHWFTGHKFLEYSVSKDAVFCYPCRVFYCGASYSDSAFTREGVRDWKNLAKKLQKHMSSQVHGDCCCKWEAYRQSIGGGGSVVSQLSTQHKITVQENRDYAKKVTDLIVFLGRQGLALRGHTEDHNSNNRGNFLELCSLFGKYDSKFAVKHIEYFNLTSPNIQNDLALIAAQQVQRRVVEEVQKVGFMCLLADEARSFKTEQLALCVRYATTSLCIVERFVGFIDCSNACNADGLAECILKGLDTAGFNGIPVIAQAYDGASVMSGKENGVQKKVREVHPAAVYMHCMAHRLNLVVVQSCKITRHAASFFDVLESLYTFFARPNNHKVFMDARNLIGLKSFSKLELTQLSDTRWSCRWRNVNTVKRLFSTIKSCLSELSVPGNGCFVQAQGLLHQLQKYEFVVCLAVFDSVLSNVQVLHKVLQKVDATIATASNVIDNTVATLEEMRSSDKQWHDIWQTVVTLMEGQAVNNSISSADHISHAGTLRTPAALRRPRKVTRMDDFVIMSTCGQRSDIVQDNVGNAVIGDTSEVWRKQLYVPVVESLVGELKRRFVDPHGTTLAKSVTAALKLNCEGVDYLLETYGRLLRIDPDLAKAEIKQARMSLGTNHADSDKSPGCSDDVTYDTLVNLSACSAELKNYPNALKLLQLAVTLPVSSATCERAFSAMRRVKNYLRTTMGQPRFSALSMLQIESDLAAEIDLDKVVDEFSSGATTPRKMKLIV